jgi:3-hydroxyacyl-[acyl-carrier protein] dehydratase/trans-2-decenoyl-[acyl-carrier protein] isomerase
VEFNGQVRPHNRVVRYEVEVQRCSVFAANAIVVGNARILVDGERVYTVSGAKVGAFRDIRYADYPRPSRNSKGGRNQ